MGWVGLVRYVVHYYVISFADILFVGGDEFLFRPRNQVGRCRPFLPLTRPPEIDALYNDVIFAFNANVIHSLFCPVQLVLLFSQCDFSLLHATFSLGESLLVSPFG